MSRTSSRRASNSANRAIARRGLNAASWFYAQSFHSTPVPAEPQSLTQCESCRRVVFTLVKGLCFVCHAWVEGKNRRDMTEEQANARHGCGVMNRRHVDGWDGNWLDCEEARRRNGL
jgi:hypothetical protein